MLRGFFATGHVLVELGLRSLARTPDVAETSVTGIANRVVANQPALALPFYGCQRGSVAGQLGDLLEQGCVLLAELGAEIVRAGRGEDGEFG